ncbi:hypothetical protein ALP99_03872 [Pseudomonas syringae pv. tomato]|nr:Uncharacterized protein ALO87_02579 [Pseudomonas syringae pv. apii]RMP37053.1 hypothetical protein ALQ23_02796 [Pseudomonas syringae pv. antirrhini]RMQ73753.1 hypothetical protein ALP99_03872 [Pseudomonas syringae pv. tomato]RMQ80077.1 hypothetical protein ALQ00_04130 [Pseudomonas syringae pv. tomato]RMU98973.1 hypothetical protein ALP19_01030 [Pseudomonas syringae pv. tomato]
MYASTAKLTVQPTARAYQRMKSFYEDIRDFLTSSIVVGDLTLPTHYAKPECFNDFQAGFRTHGNTDESLVSDAEGDWKPEWYVIAMTGLDDPVFLAVNEAGSGYPVYTAVHGAGRWDAIQIAPSLAAFGRLLKALAEVNEDTFEFNRLIMAEVRFPNEYWREVIDTRQETALLEQSSPDISDYNPADFERGNLIVSDPGPHKLKVVQIVSKCRGLPLKDALALAGAPELKAASGTRGQLHSLRAQLEAAGATVEFRPD